MGQVTANRYLTQAGWDDVPHLSEEVKTELLAEIEPHLRAARTKGEPSMGSGMIYPVAREEIECAPFQIPAHWPRAYGMDVGWRRTAAIWGALDRTTDTLHLYSEYYGAKAVPVIHATGIKARGAWIPGVIDPASRGRSQEDGKQLIATYQGDTCGLRVTPANNAVEAGLQNVWERMSTGRLKVFSTLQYFWKELRLYKRDEDGKVVKENDHLMDATRYLVMSGIPIMRVQEFRRPSRASGPADVVAGY